jgi:hypothetical protein
MEVWLGKYFKTLIKEKYDLEEHIDVTEQLIPNTFEEEVNLLNEDNTATLKRHYMACY